MACENLGPERMCPEAHASLAQYRVGAPVLLANSDPADTVWVAHLPSIPTDRRVLDVLVESRRCDGQAVQAHRQRWDRVVPGDRVIQCPGRHTFQRDPGLGNDRSRRGRNGAGDGSAVGLCNAGSDTLSKTPIRTASTWENSGGGTENALLRRLQRSSTSLSAPNFCGRCGFHSPVGCHARK